MRLLLLLALTVAAAPTRGDEPALLLPPALGRPDVVWVSGRVLEEAHGRHGPALVRNARVLAAENLSGARVEATFRGASAAGVSGHDGEFELELRAPPGSRFPPGAGQAQVRVGRTSAATTVLVVPPDAPFIVVSDFDDTVAVTHVESKRKVIENTFLKDAESQPAVPGMAALYRCLASARPSGASPAFAFVSGSPVQLAPRIVRFLEKNGFPPAALYLRNLGPDTLAGYKEPILRALAARFPQPLVLVGDSGEKDPEIYAALARELPGRVRRTYIRRSGEPGAPARFADALLFADPAAALSDAAARGLAPAQCR